MSEISAILAHTNHYRTIESTNLSSIESIEGEVVPTNKVSLSNQQAESVVASCEDLITDKLYRPFFFKKLYSVGPSTFMQLADHARKYGKQPDRLFVKLLRDLK